MSHALGPCVRLQSYSWCENSPPPLFPPNRENYTSLVLQVDTPSKAQASRMFTSVIQNIGVAGTEMLVGFDVQFRYTNISGEKAVTVLLEILEREEDILGAERTRLIDLTQQIFGLPMASPLSPLLANVYMDRLAEELEKSALQPRALMR
ncbi:unnamed protein product [Protopolystoma xenopodis]|uniref:Reverse transcriptase domain-containing protein n=1 Tax=Protopolystoma xenopodis TaxID=117903 RepID=A0A3S4ZYQ4_9PLAT|nr:unnamed protein product [Protopolystoma xenopodis]